MLNLGAGPKAILNPKITWRSDQSQWVRDDCLSVPDTLVHIERHHSISVSFRDEAGHTIDWELLAPDMAELPQHEIDHLDGILMTERAEDSDAIVPISMRAELDDKPRNTPAGSDAVPE